MDFKQIMADMKVRKQLADPVRAVLVRICDEEMIQKAMAIHNKEDSTAKEQYLSFLKAFGRVKGSEIYRMLKQLK